MKKKKPQDEGNRKPIIAQLRGSSEFKEWTEGLAEFDNRSLSSLVDRSLRRYAIEIGYKKPAPER